MNLSDLIALYQEHLYLPDPAALELVLGVLAASRMPGKQPVWLLLVGPPSAGKTVLFDMIADEDDVEVVSTVTEAGLLSGSLSNSDKATGGLLAKLGERGVLCIKDFTSILSTSSQDRNKIFAALREIHDGLWVRHLGTGGGRTFGWVGRLFLLGAVTEVIDLHTAAIGSMGERYLYYRLPALDEHERMELDAAAATNAPREEEVRALLAAATKQFLAELTVPTELERLSKEADESLGRICDLATKCRTPLSRENGRVVLVPEPEATPRLHGMIYLLIQGLLAIGLSEEECWRLAHEVALGSIPKSRRGVIDLLASTSREWKVTDVAAELSLDRDTVYRITDDLVALGVAEHPASSQAQIQASGWLAERWGQTHVGAYVRVRQSASGLHDGS